MTSATPSPRCHFVVVYLVKELFGEDGDGIFFSVDFEGGDAGIV